MADNVTVDNSGLSDFAVSTEELADSSHVQNMQLVTVSGTSKTNLAKTEDDQHTTGDLGIFILAVRKDVAASTAGSDGDYTALVADSSGRLHTSVGSMPATARATDVISSVPLLGIGTDPDDLADATILRFSESVTASDTDEELVAAQGAGTYLLICALSVSVAGTATASTFESSGSTRVHKVALAANGVQVLPFNPLGWFACADNAALTVTTGTGSDTDITGVVAVMTT